MNHANATLAAMAKVGAILAEASECCLGSTCGRSSSRRGVGRLPARRKQGSPDRPARAVLPLDLRYRLWFSRSCLLVAPKNTGLCDRLEAGLRQQLASRPAALHLLVGSIVVDRQA